MNNEYFDEQFGHINSKMDKTNQTYFDQFGDMTCMMRYLIEKMENEIQPLMQTMEKEIKTLKEENTELKLNLIAISPMYSNEQKDMAIEQLKNINNYKENSVERKLM